MNAKTCWLVLGVVTGLAGCSSDKSNGPAKTTCIDPCTLATEAEVTALGITSKNPPNSRKTCESTQSPGACTWGTIAEGSFQLTLFDESNHTTARKAAETTQSSFQDVSGLGQGAFYGVTTFASVSSYNLSMLVNHRSIQMIFSPVKETRSPAEILAAMKTLATAVAGRL